MPKEIFLQDWKMYLGYTKFQSSPLIFFFSKSLESKAKFISCLCKKPVSNGKIISELCGTIEQDPISSNPNSPQLSCVILEFHFSWTLNF